MLPTTISNACYNVFLEIIWQLCALYNILRGIFLKVFPPTPPARVEPPADTEWYSLSYISGGLDTYGASSPRSTKVHNTPKLVEKYYSNFADVLDAYSDIPLREAPRTLFLHNYSNGTTLVRKGEPVDVSTPPEPSKTSIIYAEYRHPEMDEPIMFSKLGTRYSLSENELFTPEFVLRYLEYNCARGSFVFDDNYSLTVMDNSMNVYEGVVIL